MKNCCQAAWQKTERKDRRRRGQSSLSHRPQLSPLKKGTERKRDCSVHGWISQNPVDQAVSHSTHIHMHHFSINSRGRVPSNLARARRYQIENITSGVRLQGNSTRLGVASLRQVARHSERRRASASTAPRVQSSKSRAAGPNSCFVTTWE